jgi:hypothetical protein
VPCAFAGHVIGAGQAHLKHVAAQAPVSYIYVVPAVYGAPAPPECLCLRVVGATRDGLAKARQLLLEQAALAMAWTRPGRSGQGQAWVPPQLSPAPILPTPARPAGVTSYGAAGAHDNAQLRYQKDLLNTAAATAGGKGGGGKPKKSKAAKKAAKRARPEERERQRQARDGSGSPEGGGGGAGL